MTKQKIGLLVMAYGTPYKDEDIEPYYTHIRRGRKPSPEKLDNLRRRYQAIGGISPLAKITKDQAFGLQDHLNSVQEEYEFKAYIGLRHIDPFIEDAVEKMHEDGIEEAVSIVLAPHFSTMSIKAYNDRAKEVAEKLGGPNITSVESWHDEPKFIAHWVEKVKAVYKQMPADERDNACLIVSAHSLPERIIQSGDPYTEQLAETAKLIVKDACVNDYAIGWQSEGNTPEPWIGPDVQDLTRKLHKEKGYKAFVYIPVGFVSEHLEVLYDNDYECKVVTDEVGASYYRPIMPNAQKSFLDAMATVVLKHMK